jgi:sigma-B regulation protein RsbU (phosphoserine phosphatase)
MSIPASSALPSLSGFSAEPDFAEVSRSLQIEAAQLRTVWDASAPIQVQTEPSAVNPLAAESGIHQERLLQLGREQRRMQDLFSALAFALRSFKNLNQILELIVFVASHLTDAEGGAVIVFNANGSIQLEQIHCSDHSKREQIRALMEKVTHSLSVSAHSAVTADLHHSSVEPDTLPAPLSPPPLDSSEQSAWIEQVLDEQLRHDLGEDVQLFGTPLLIRNTVRGRLYVFSRQSGYSWTDNRQQLLRVIADQTAVAIENDELTAELRKKNLLDKELEIGSEIQAQLLPRQCPEIPGILLAARCQTANKVGGDYYDFIKVPSHPVEELPSLRSRLLAYPPKQPLETQQWGIVIGDVMGKGVPAGLLMTMTRGMLRAEVLNYHSPARILQHLNQVMFSDLENSNRFISLFYSEYNPQTRQLCFSNAAHNPTLWWHAATQEIQPLDTAGTLIGLDPHSTYEQQCVQLQPGDVVVYYTDGFTDAANARGERLEASGLENAIQKAAQHHQDPQDILHSLFEQVEAFRRNARAHRNSIPPDHLTLEMMQELGGDGALPLPIDYFRSDLNSVDDMTLVVLKVLAGEEEATSWAACGCS